MGAIREKSPGQDLTSAKELSIELTKGTQVPYHRLN